MSRLNVEGGITQDKRLIIEWDLKEGTSPLTRIAVFTAAPGTNGPFSLATTSRADISDRQIVIQNVDPMTPFAVMSFGPLGFRSQNEFGATLSEGVKHPLIRKRISPLIGRSA